MNKKCFFTFADLLHLLGLLGLTSVIGINSAAANSKVLDNLNQKDLFIYHGNLKLTNSKLNIAEIQGASHIYNNDFNGSVTINGNCDLKENKFTKILQLTGESKSENNIFEDKLNINGNFKDKDSHFLSTVKIIGKANFDSSELSNNLEIDSNEIKLTDSSANNILFNNKEDPRVISLHLNKNTKINGDIIFSNDRGKVYADESVVISGKITGGEIINK
ncbi:MAG: hypothetical protein KBD64_02820 [Gammaproteobacteria bacterium]|nr:hypothetical protein [Gammaproteobacteria bacterium]